MRPSSIPKTCDGCGKESTINHILNCRIGELINSRHNEIKSEIIDIRTKAYGPTSIHDKPLMNSNSDENNNNSNSNNNTRADLMVRGL